MNPQLMNSAEACSSSSCSRPSKNNFLRKTTSRIATFVGALSTMPYLAEGLGDMDGLFNAETKCPVFECPEGQVPVQKPAGTKKKDWPVVYGCDASSFDMMMMLDPSALQGGMPKKGGNSQKLWKCCVNRDVAQQVCGVTKADMEGGFSKCSKKKCKGDKSCSMSANFGVMMSGGVSGDKCKEYNDSQAANCMCVPQEDEEKTFMKAVEQFYGIFAKDKLPKKVDEKWLGDTVYKKFKKDEKPQIWKTLFEKYSSSLQHKEKPKPDYGLGDDLGGLGDLGKDKKPDTKAKKKSPPPVESDPEPTNLGADAEDGEIVEEEL